MDQETPQKEYPNPSAVLKFSKLYKFIVKIVIFHCQSGTTKNDQLLCGHFQFKSYLVMKLVNYLHHFQFSSYPMTKFVLYLGHFQLAHLKFLNFDHLSIEKTMVTKFFGHLVTYLSFSTSEIQTLDFPQVECHEFFSML